MCVILCGPRASSWKSQAFPASFYQKNPRVRKIFCPQFWGRKRLRQFYGRLEKCALSAGKTCVHKIRRLRGGVFGFFGGASADFIFMGARIFLILSPANPELCPKNLFGLDFNLKRLFKIFGLFEITSENAR